MKFLFVIISICLPLLSQSQDATTFAPIGSTFYYSTWFPPGPELLTFVSVGDTILNGIQSRIIKFYKPENGILSEVPELEKYVYTEGNQVYYWVQDNFYLLYDFGALPGDTIHSRVEDFPISLGCASNFGNEPFDFSYRIDSTGTMIIDELSLRIQYTSPIYGGLDSNWIIPNPIIERIGTYAMSSFWWGKGEFCFPGGIHGELRCYADEEINFKNEFAHFDLPCDYVSSTDNTRIDEAKFYPNPTTNYIQLNREAEFFIIHDLYGRKMAKGKNKSVIELHDLPSNIYIINYKIENTWHTARLVKN